MALARKISCQFQNASCRESGVRTPRAPKDVAKRKHILNGFARSFGVRTRPRVAFIRSSRATLNLTNSPRSDPPHRIVRNSRGAHAWFSFDRAKPSRAGYRPAAEVQRFLSAVADAAVATVHR